MASAFRLVSADGKVWPPRLHRSGGSQSGPKPSLVPMWLGGTPRENGRILYYRFTVEVEAVMSAAEKVSVTLMPQRHPHHLDGRRVLAGPFVRGCVVLSTILGRDHDLAPGLPRSSESERRWLAHL